MKSIVFDAGPVISLTMNNLLWIFKSLESKYKGEFYISNAVKNELIDKPLKIKRFKFEALQVLQYLNKDIIKIVDNERIKKTTLELLDLANNCFKARGNWIQVVHYGEMEGIAACLYLNSDAFVVDERTTRTLIENPKREIDILKRTLHVDIKVNEENLKKFREMTKNIKIIRSVELVTIAYELGLLNEFLPNMENAKEILLDSVLWGVKLDGCAVSKREIEQILKMER